MIIHNQKELLKAKLQLAKALAKEQKYREENLCFFFKPYKWMYRYLDSIRNHQIVIAPVCNKIGKCLTSKTLISTPDGEISLGKLHEDGKPFKVYAWDGEKKVIANAHAPFKKERKHKCYKINMSDGRVIEAADHHLLLTHDGWQTTKDLLDTFSNNLQETSSVLYPSTHAGDGQHLKKTRQGYQDDYLMNRHPNDEQPLPATSNDQVLFPLQADVLKHNDLLFERDGLENKYINNLLPFFFHPSSLCDRFHSVVLSAGSLFYDFLLYASKFLLLSPTAPKPCTVEGIELQPNLSPLQQEFHRPLLSPLYVDGNKIISYNFIGYQDVYDFQVDEHHNYFAGGLINHNSACTANVVLSWCMGFEPWNRVEKDHPEAVLFQGKYYRSSSLGIKPPVKILITGEDWSVHLGTTVIPELKKWFPADEYTTKNNQNGFEAFFNFRNGSSIVLMTHNMDDKLFESFVAHGWWPDEPPPRSKYTGIQRGLKGTGGKTVIPTTPLREAWMLDDLVLSGRRDIGVIDGLNITSNDAYYENDLNLLTEMGLTEQQIKEYYDILLNTLDKGKKAEKFLYSIAPADKQDLTMKLIILNMFKDCPLDERDTRLFGMFKSLVGRVLKSFDKDKHIIKAFEVPPDWPVIAMIDFHLNKPHAISFYTVDERNIKYVIDEVWENMSSESVADTIIRRKLSKSWRLEDVYIDPLSKGDTQYMKNRMGDEIEDSFTVIKNKLADYDIDLQVASKDKTSGISNLLEWLEGVNGLPTVFFLDSLQSAREEGAYGHIHEIMRWVYDDDGLPKKENDHFCENFYRSTLTGLVYKPLDDPQGSEQDKKRADAYNPFASLIRR